MLKDRIVLTGNGFQVMPDGVSDDSEMGEKKGFFGLYSLSQDADMIPQELFPITYWDPVKAYEHALPGSESLVYIREEVDGKIVEEERVFWVKNKKPLHLELGIESNRKFGKGAQVITITWLDSPGDKINHKYIYLENRKTGDIFYFLKKCITPLEKSKNVEDIYIFVVPEGDDPDNYVVNVRPELLKKYQIVRG